MFPIRDHNPSERTPFVVYTLIAINVAIFLWGLIAFPEGRGLAGFYHDWALVPARISAGEGYLGALTSMFLHGGWAHIAGNMLFLWIFGDNMEEEWGHLPFAIFYLVTGLAAGALQYVTAPYSSVPTIGASGAIAGVMGGYLLLFPKARVDIFVFFVVFFRIFPIPAWIMLALWFVFQLVGGFGTAAGGAGVAYWAHAGGFIAGVVLAIPLLVRRGGRRFWQRTDGHPPHPEARYSPSRIPVVRRR